jgi:hypothetical protein
MTRSTLVIIGVFTLSGCHYFQKGTIRAGGSTVIGVPDAGKPATLAQDTSVGTLPLPAGSRLVMTKWEPVAWHAATDTSPEVKAQPGREVTEVFLSRDTQWRKDETHIQADTGTVDTSIAQHRIDVAEDRILLFVSIGAAVLGGVFLYLKYPTPALICGCAAVVFFMAWRLSGLPPWFHVLGFAGLAAAVFMWLGHRRGEHDGVKAALAGDVEPKNPPVVKS